MKNNIQLLALTLTITLTSQFSGNLYAQKNALKINLASIGKYSLEYERAYDSKNTLMVGFQKWHQSTSNSSSLAFLGIIASEDQTTEITGFRTEFLARHYGKKTYNGGFFESGLYVGKQDITITKRNSTFNTLAIFLLEVDQISDSSTEVREYENVVVAGGKIGGGFQKALGFFDFEFSGGINVNALNSKNIRPVLALKGISPYARVAIGVAF